MPVLPVGRDLPVDELTVLLVQALAGGPTLLPVNADSTRTATSHAAGPVPDGTALLLPTSGSTGTPKIVELPAAALLAAARACHQRVGPPGRWLLALPLTHIAGWMVLVRSLLAPGQPTPAVLDGPFTAAAFTAALQPDVAYTSLVPTQLGRILEDRQAVAAARSLTILLGGAPAPPTMLTRAIDAGIRVVTTYGSTETCGGCVYDGFPLDGVQVRLTADGRLAFAGDVLATGYRPLATATAGSEGPEGGSQAGFVRDGGRRWFVSSDLGQITAGHVSVLGRADDVIVTGGEKVSPSAVEHVLAGLPGIGQVLVVGVADPHWGQAVTALIVTDHEAPDAGPLDADTLRSAVRRHLGRHAVPRHLLQVATLPTSGIGKPDRREATAQATALLAGGPAPAACGYPVREIEACDPNR